MTEAFSYGTLGPELTSQVIEAYREFQSCERVPVAAELPVSSATVSRVVRSALSEGVLSPEEKRGRGAVMLPREPILNALENHPTATIEQIAGFLGVSVATVYRAKNGI